MDWESKDEVGDLVGMMRETVIQAARSMTVSQQQTATIGEAAVKGPMWVAKFALPRPPEDTMRKHLLQVIDDLGEGKATYTEPQPEAIDTEWIGYRKGVDKDTPEPSISETEKYAALMKDTSAPGVVMFIYGGAFYMNNPARYRKITVRLAKLTGLRCMMVRQRLAPQNPFPAALLDVLHGYLSLLGPHPASPHVAVPASSIVLAGDSSGAALALGLLQVLLNLKRRGISTIEYHGREIELALPAGFTLMSTVGELTNSLPPYKANAMSDVFPPDLTPTILPGFPSCEIWPSSPPRGNIYCDSSTLCHPIASPAASYDWTGSPSLWFVSGQEQIVDGTKLIAKTAFSQGVDVVFQEYEAMPHCFMWNFPEAPQSQRFWSEWSQTCTTLLEGKAITSHGSFIELKGLQANDVDLRELTSLTVEDARHLMIRASKRYRPFLGAQNSRL